MLQSAVNCGEWILTVIHLLVRSHSNEFKIVSAAFDFPYNDVPSHVQLELIELQVSDVLLSKFTSFIDFYRQLLYTQFSTLLASAERVIAMFGST